MDDERVRRAALARARTLLAWLKASGYTLTETRHGALVIEDPDGIAVGVLSLASWSVTPLRSIRASR